MTHEHRHAAPHDHAAPDPSLSPTQHWEQRYAGDERIWSGRVNATLA